MMSVIKAIGIFVIAGLCEIGGGYMVWLWLREQKHWWYGVLGGLILVLYGIVATLQPANFGRVYAAYGGVFIVLAILWGWKVDGFVPDKFDIIGGIISLIGMGIIMFAPRN
jgi:small multidrug resistance family-3 protein